MLSLVYQFGLRRLLFAVDPELAHKWAIAFCQTVSQSPQLQSMVSAACVYKEPRLQQRLWGIDFPNPVGLAAGFDKDAIAAGAWSSFGFGFAEVGTITFHGQAGNPQPRLFRLAKDEAILNRMGFNNRGAEATAAYLQQAYFPIHPIAIPLGINLGKSKITDLDAAKDEYASSFKLLKEYGNYFVVNVSSPNTPGLRDLQAVDQLQGILAAIQVQNLQNKPVLVKIAPDLNDQDVVAIVNIALSQQVAGIIATNTSISRDRLITHTLPTTGKLITEEAGGISGKPLRSRSTDVIKLIYQTSAGKLPIIGVGGIFSADDAWEKITAGSTLVQIYTGWIYQGPTVVKEILHGLVQKLNEHNLENINQAIGISNKT